MMLRAGMYTGWYVFAQATMLEAQCGPFECFIVREAQNSLLLSLLSKFLRSGLRNQDFTFLAM